MAKKSDSIRSVVGELAVFSLLNKKSKRVQKGVDKGRRRCYISKAVFESGKSESKNFERREKRLDKLE